MVPLLESLHLKGQVQGQAHAHLLKYFFPVILSDVNNPTHVYLSDLRVYFKLEVYFRVTEVGWRSTKIAGKTSGLCQHYQR